MAGDWEAAARLVRRTGFGATGEAVDAVLKEGTAAYVARILAADPQKDPGALKTPAPKFAPVAPMSPDPSADEKAKHRQALGAQSKQLTAWWLQRMVAAEQPFGEKSTFVWHGHFATSLQKVKSAPLMLAQNERLRTLGRGDFRTLAYSVLTDGATLRWLDGVKNTVKGPNENLSREFMEIFTLGHGDGYTEADVRDGARALTGLKINPQTGAVAVRPALHDNRSKTLFGKTGDYDAGSFCDAVLGRPGSAKYIVSRMWRGYVSNSDPSGAVLDKLTAAYGAHRDLRALFSAMFTDESFATAEGEYIVGPVEWLIGAVRALRVPTDDEKTQAALAASLRNLGQLPLYPPSVGGWPSGMVWMSTAAADLRFRSATLITKQAQLPALTGSATAKLEAVAHLLGVAQWSDQTLAVLKGSMQTPQTLVAVALNTPEYLVH